MEVEICGIKYTEADVSYEAAQEALAVQNACNLSGVLFALERRTQEICDHKNNQGTDWKNHHPVLVLFLAQYAFLCTGDSIDHKAWLAAHDLCQEVVDAGELLIADANHHAKTL